MTGIEVEALDKRLGFRVGVGIKSLVRMAIAGKETLQPDDIPVLRRADDHGAAGSSLDQTYPAKNESAHNALAKFRFRHEQRSKPFGCDDERLYQALRVGIDQRRPARQLRQLAYECAWAMCNDSRVASRLIALGHLHVAREQDRQALAYLA